MGVARGFIASKAWALAAAVQCGWHRTVAWTGRTRKRRAIGRTVASGCPEHLGEGHRDVKVRGRKVALVHERQEIQQHDLLFLRVRRRFLLVICSGRLRPSLCLRVGDSRRSSSRNSRQRGCRITQLEAPYLGPSKSPHSAPHGAARRPEHVASAW